VQDAAYQERAKGVPRRAAGIKMEKEDGSNEDKTMKRWTKQ